MEKRDPPETPPGASDQTSLTLLERAKARDVDAWYRLVDLYSPLIFSWCLRSGLDLEDSRDVLQETLAAVAANLGQFHRWRPGDTFRGWVRVIFRNQSALYCRQKAQQPRAVGGTTANLRMREFPDRLPADSASEVAEASSLFHRGLELIRCEFESRTWQAFWLTAIDRCPSDEVCARLQMTAGAVRQAKYRVLRRLRCELGDVLK
jgi:RNA polymerase sigma-70 factor, ECF subfamily